MTIKLLANEILLDNGQQLANDLLLDNSEQLLTKCCLIEVESKMNFL